jgi:hypothetical protein
MKRRIAVFCALMLIPVSSAFCLDLGVEVWTGNLGFRSDRPAADVSLPGADYLLGGSVFVAQPITESFSFETGFFSDPILRNISYTLFQYEEKVISIGVGPFFGFFNDATATTILKPGISTSVKVEMPGIVFIKFRSDSSIGGGLVEVGSYLQEKTDVSLGVYIHNAICSLNLSQRKFTQKQDAYTVIDALTDYSFQTDIFQKNTPYRVLISLGYQILSKTYIGTATATHILNSVIVGTDLDFTFLDSAVFTLNLESNVYSFGQGQLVGSSANYLFRAFTGFRLSVDKILSAGGSAGR